MTDYRQVARERASVYGLDPDLFERQIGAESNFNPKAGSPAGAQGIAQIMPGTAKGWGVNPHDPVASLDAAAKAMAKYVKSYGSYENALVAYNAGPGRVGKPLYKETANYIKKIMGGKGGGGGKLAAPAPVKTASAYGLKTGGAFVPKRTYSSLFSGGSKSDEWFGQQLDSSINRGRARQAAAAAPAPAAVAAEPGAAVALGKQELSGYKSLLNLGSKYGLRIDGSNQTTGGQHSKGSLHYSGKAVDFGDAKNSPEKLAAIAAYAKANPGQFRELYFNKLGWGIKNGKIIKGLTVSGHDDHLHAATY